MIKNCLLGLALALFLISVAVTIALNFIPLYMLDVRLYGLDQICGLSRERLMENYRILIDYSNLWGAKTLEFPDFPMSETGRIHFEEAKRIFCAFELGVPVMGLITMLGVLLEKRKRRWGGKRFRFLQVGGILAIGLPIVLAAACAAMWDKVFVTFHHLFFNNDFWIFDERTDPIIRVLPDQFFLHEAVLIFILVALGGILSIRIFRRLNR